MTGDFFRRVEHDLRGELATMMAGVHYLLRYEKGLATSAVEMLERVHGAGERLKRLLDEFGDGVWIDEADGEDLSISTYELGVLVEPVLEKLARSAGGRGVTLRARPGGGNGSFLGDADVLRAALEYSIDLAVARSRNQTVTIGWDVVGGRPVVTVVDQAGSVPEDRIAHLLEPFVEQEVVPRPLPGTRKRDRLGLGLAIAKGILEAHGGSLSVELAEDKSGLIQRCILGSEATFAKQSA